jgi:hypothetical protein
MENFMKKMKISAYALSTILLATAPQLLGAVETDPKICHEMAVETEAGRMHFDFIMQTQPVPGFLQAVASVDPQNNTFELPDGSVWATSKIEMINGWTEADQLVISQNQAFFSTHRFALVNLRLGKAVPVSMIREARPESAMYITGIDRANDIITLNKDNQQWVIDSADHGTLRRYSEHDRIVLGVNTSDCCDHEKVMRYLLIDTTTNQCVRATPLNR